MHLKFIILVERVQILERENRKRDRERIRRERVKEARYSAPCVHSSSARLEKPVPHCYSAPALPSCCPGSAQPDVSLSASGVEALLKLLILESSARTVTLLAVRQ